MLKKLFKEARPLLPFMALKSLTWFEDAEEESDSVMLYPLECEEVKGNVVRAVKSVG